MRGLRRSAVEAVPDTGNEMILKEEGAIRRRRRHFRLKNQNNDLTESSPAIIYHTVFETDMKTMCSISVHVTHSAKQQKRVDASFAGLDGMAARQA